MCLNETLPKPSKKEKIKQRFLSLFLEKSNLRKHFTIEPPKSDEPNEEAVKPFIFLSTNMQIRHYQLVSLFQRHEDHLDWVAYDEQIGRPVLIKVFREPVFAKPYLKLGRFKVPPLPTIFDFFYWMGYPLMVLEWPVQGTNPLRFESDKADALSFKTKLRMFCDLTQALQGLHHAGLFHGSLALEKLYWFSGEARGILFGFEDWISDWGSSKHFAFEYARGQAQDLRALGSIIGHVLPLYHDLGQRCQHAGASKTVRLSSLHQFFKEEFAKEFGGKKGR